MVVFTVQFSHQMEMSELRSGNLQIIVWICDTFVVTFCQQLYILYFQRLTLHCDWSVNTHMTTV